MVSFSRENRNSDLHLIARFLHGSVCEAFPGSASTPWVVLGPPEGVPGAREQGQEIPGVSVSLQFSSFISTPWFLQSLPLVGGHGERHS